MKYNIPGDEDRMRMEIKHLITLHIKRVTKKNTSPCSRRKLSPSVSNSRYITFTTKYSQMIIRRSLFKKKLTRCFIIQ